jgi:hypothetical protein
MAPNEAISAVIFVAFVVAAIQVDTNFLALELYELIALGLPRLVPAMPETDVILVDVDMLIKD